MNPFFGLFCFSLHISLRFHFHFHLFHDPSMYSAWLVSPFDQTVYCGRKKEHSFLLVFRRLLCFCFFLCVLLLLIVLFSVWNREKRIHFTKIPSPNSVVRTYNNIVVISILVRSMDFSFICNSGQIWFTEIIRVLPLFSRSLLSSSFIFASFLFIRPFHSIPFPSIPNVCSYGYFL